MSTYYLGQANAKNVKVPSAVIEEMTNDVDINNKEAEVNSYLQLCSSVIRESALSLQTRSF